MVVLKNSNRKETKMAHGIACKNCGWQEAYHTGLVNISEESEENPKKNPDTEFLSTDVLTLNIQHEILSMQKKNKKSTQLPRVFCVLWEK